MKRGKNLECCRLHWWDEPLLSQHSYLSVLVSVFAPRLLAQARVEWVRNLPLSVSPCPLSAVLTYLTLPLLLKGSSRLRLDSLSSARSEAATKTSLRCLHSDRRRTTGKNLQRVWLCNNFHLESNYQLRKRKSENRCVTWCATIAMAGCVAMCR